MSRRITPEVDARLRSVIGAMWLYRPDLAARPPSLWVLLRFAVWLTVQRVRNLPRRLVWGVRHALRGL
jgi:hypothetical protein